MFGVFLALALAAGPSDVLDAKALVQVIDQTIADPASTPALTGRRLRVILPVATDGGHSLRSYQSPARWRYSHGDQILEISVGLGEITPTNYDQFVQQGLASAPPQQTLYFTTVEHRRPMVFRTESRTATTYDTGDQRTAVSYGLAASFSADGKISELPKGFLPAMSYRTKMDPRLVDNVTRGMTLELDGEVVDLAGRPNILCGDFVGAVKAAAVTGDTPIQIRDKQCFVTARITEAVIRNDAGVVLAKWGTSAP
jgi:hypothetical protein